MLKIFDFRPCCGPGNGIVVVGHREGVKTKNGKFSVKRSLRIPKNKIKVFGLAQD